VDGIEEMLREREKEDGWEEFLFPCFFGHAAVNAGIYWRDRSRKCTTTSIGRKRDSMLIF
jgi:hypothetical protein